MQQIVNFILRNKNFLLFLFLFGIAILFTIQSHSYHRSKFINSANFLSGGIYNFSNNVSTYFNLKSQNELLAKENTRLNELLANKKIESNENFNNQYQYTKANIIKNSYSLTNNFLLINKGENNGVKTDFGVCSSNGIIGIVDNTSNKYATVISILNSESSISVKLKNTNHIGSLIWDGNNPNIVKVTDVEKIAPLNKGDTIITSGQSSIFPKGIPVGTILNYKLDITQNFHEIDVFLFNDMTNIEHVYVIENNDKKEIEVLLNSQNE